MASPPRGQWKYKGVIMKEEGGNHHHSIVEFKRQWFLFYYGRLKEANYPAIKYSLNEPK